MQYNQIGKQRFLKLLIAFVLGFCLFLLASCSRHQAEKLEVIRLDYATYNPVSLVLKEKKWMETEFSKDNIKIQWALSLGSNKALQLLNSTVVDFASTAGSSSLIARANGSLIKGIYIYSHPEWTALVAAAKSPISRVEDLRGKRIAVAVGTDTYVFLLRALEQFGLSDRDVELVQMQQNNGMGALENGTVDAWAGLDPYMAKSELEKGSRLFFRDPAMNSYGLLNVREDFAQEYPGYIERVIAVYEKARQWAIAHPDEFKEILMREARLTEPIAAKQLQRTDLSNLEFNKGEDESLKAAGNVLVKSGTIKQSTNISQVIKDLIDSRFVEKVKSVK